MEATVGAGTDQNRWVSSMTLLSKSLYRADLPHGCDLGPCTTSAPAVTARVWAAPRSATRNAICAPFVTSPSFDPYNAKWMKAPSVHEVAAWRPLVHGSSPW